MNNKRVVGKRYKSPNDSHSLKWERLEEYRIGNKILWPGQVVKIHGQRAASFEFLYGEKHLETGAVNLTFVGGRRGHRLVRTFTPDKVSTFLYVAQHYTPEEEEEEI